MTYRIKFEYRDACNYKTHFNHEVNCEDFPQVVELKVESEVFMGELGTLAEDEFFNSEIHPYRYNVLDDHNILSVLEINTLEEE